MPIATKATTTMVSQRLRLTRIVAEVVRLFSSGMATVLGHLANDTNRHGAVAVAVAEHVDYCLGQHGCTLDRPRFAQDDDCRERDDDGESDSDAACGSALRRCIGARAGIGP